MKHLIFLATLAFLALNARGQELYFPAPQANAPWETEDPEVLGWCTDQLPPLLDFLEDSNTKAFLVLKDGKIVIEEYFGTFTADSNWYWASAGKSLTAFLVGRAQQEGLLNINNPTSTYLGAGWTSLTPAQEQAITVRNQLTMTTGLDDGIPNNNDCTDPACLQYLAPAGTRWAYHNGPYTLLDGVLTNATGLALNTFLFTRLTQSTGITGLYIQTGENNVFFSKARSMARFGLLMQGQGTWNGTPILSDAAYYNAMITPSQTLNNSYGYLWWLNGQSSYVLPGFQLVINAPLLPASPPDCYNALGKNGQILSVSPSRGLVVVRMGNLPTQDVFVPNAYADDIWELLNAVACSPTAVEKPTTEHGLVLYPNPAQDKLTIALPLGDPTGEVHILDAVGRVVITRAINTPTADVDLGTLAPGSYRCTLTTATGRSVQGFVKE